MVKDNFKELKEIIDQHKTLEEKQKQNTIVGQIGSNLYWLSSGAYSYMPSLYSNAEEKDGQGVAQNAAEPTNQQTPAD